MKTAKEQIAEELQLREASTAVVASDLTSRLRKILNEGYVASDDLAKEDVPSAIRQLKAVVKAVGDPVTDEALAELVERWMQGDSAGLSDEDVEKIVEASLTPVAVSQEMAMDAVNKAWEVADALGNMNGADKQALAQAASHLKHHLGLIDDYLVMEQ